MKAFAVLSFLILLTSTAYADVAGGANDGMLNAIVCNEADAETATDTHNAACGAFVSGDPCGASNQVSCNDGTTISDKGAPGTYFGYEVEVYNTSITNCLSITTVEAAWEWWTDTGTTPSSCTIRIDAEDEASWNSISTTCPGTSANPGITYIDVTTGQGETYACSDFFGGSADGAWIQTNVAIAERNNNLFQDLLGYRVTYDIPEFPSLAIPVIFIITLCLFSLRKR